MALEQRRQLLISRGWIQAVAIVMIFGFTVMGMLAYWRMVKKFDRFEKARLAASTSLFGLPSPPSR